MSDTNNHGEEISADAYATLVRHQFKLEFLGDRLHRIENTTATMKDKWRKGDEAMRDFTTQLCLSWGLVYMRSDSSNKSGRFPWEDEEDEDRERDEEEDDDEKLHLSCCLSCLFTLVSDQVFVRELKLIANSRDRGEVVEVAEIVEQETEISEQLRRSRS
ncbi:hypothetical protein F2Q70_00004070 [Brassica cretica]|uniref:Uncharacterized protein n=1 Tax=Brassica cretica TaxID=69181 RepID=A0A8S9J0P1_BRACR|nr:hypothetical protein F2Q70_00004070 [Brassica cretica]